MELHDKERIDALNIKGYKIIQRSDGFCFGMDAVLLTGFCKVKKAEKVLDLGTGTGVIPLLLSAKTEGSAFMGLEIQEIFAEMAKRSVELNQLEERVHIVQGDIKEAAKLFPLSSFDVVTSNPPYMNSGKGLVNPSSMKAIARHEVLCSLEDVVRAAAKLVRVGGRFYMVHRPQRLMEILETLRTYKLEPKRIRMVHSYVNTEATMVLVEAVRRGNPLMRVEAPLIIYKEENVYTEEIHRIYGE